MTAAASPRKASAKALTARTAAHVRSDLAASEAETSDALAQVEKLRAQTPEILRRAEDDEHKGHEDELARLDRILARAEARHEDLAAELGVLEVREAEADRDREREQTRARAESAVAEVVGKIATQYTGPAETIAAFLAEWTEAENLARAAGVRGPSAGIRHVPGHAEPDQSHTYTAYLDEQGNQTTNPHPLKPDGTYDQTRERKPHTFTQVTPGRRWPGKLLPSLPATVNLPKIDDQGEHHRAERPSRNAWA